MNGENKPAREKMLALLIERETAESYVPGADVPPAEALGTLVSRWAQWDGGQIVDAFLSALEDANYHTFRNKVQTLWLEELERMEAHLKKIQEQTRPEAQP